MKRYFVTGIGTEVGKTIAAAIITEALEADYWKPVQSGELNDSDAMKVKELISNEGSFFHPEAYKLTQPMSPHAAAERDGVDIDLNSIQIPKTENHLVVEGAGGLLVPLNSKKTILDLIEIFNLEVVLVSRHYLGSINHTLMTIETIKNRGLIPAGIIFSGDEHPTTEAIITTMSQVPIIGRIDEEPYFDTNVVCEYADRFRESLQKL